MLRAHEPTVTVAAVDARHKPEDLVHELARLGGADVLAVEHLRTTRDPDTLAELALPFVSIDGHAATPDRWFALTQRSRA